MDSVLGIKVLDGDYKKFKPVCDDSALEYDEFVVQKDKRINPYVEKYKKYKKLVNDTNRWGKRMLNLQMKAVEVVNTGTSTLDRLNKLMSLVRSSDLTIHLKIAQGKILEIYSLEKAVGINVIDFSNIDAPQVDALLSVENINKKFYSLDKDMMREWKNQLGVLENEHKVLAGIQDEYYHYISKGEVRKKLLPETKKYNALLKEVYRKPSPVNMEKIAMEFDQKYKFVVNGGMM